ncbi:virulence RhuM family protein [Aerococcaceae bacterium DSM 111020]|nr:virulence RhuM family protein [Aerococcaceae bacterium DSM 111020]
MVNESTISKHIKNIFNEEELLEDSVVAKFATTASDGENYQVKHYNLKLIISLGYRVKFRITIHFWTLGNRPLKEYSLKSVITGAVHSRKGVCKF